MFKNSFQYTLHSETRDPKGNFIILDVSTQEQRLSLVALYGPNEDSPDFFENLKSKLVSLSNTSVIIGGDWNVVQDFNFDTEERRCSWVETSRIIKFPFGSLVSL
jgi:hypothetical protein